jgi:hypothetical protein
MHPVNAATDSYDRYIAGLVLGTAAPEHHHYAAHQTPAQHTGARTSRAGNRDRPGLDGSARSGVDLSWGR